MTVGKLIKELSKFKKSDKVAILDHDSTGMLESGGGEMSLSWNGPVICVESAPEGVKKEVYNVVIR